MYWIEVKLENDEVIRKESTTINETYEVLGYYMQYNKQVRQDIIRAELITAGRGDKTTGVWELA